LTVLVLRRAAKILAEVRKHSGGCGPRRFVDFVV